jgi:hypothetical protein
LLADFDTFQASGATTGANNYGVLVPGQVNFAYDLIRTTFNTFPTSLAFSGIEGNKGCPGMFPVKKSWFHLLFFLQKCHVKFPPTITNVNKYRVSYTFDARTA